jgi:hypothetical protein
MPSLYRWGCNLFTSSIPFHRLAYFTLYPPKYFFGDVINSSSLYRYLPIVFCLLRELPYTLVGKASSSEIFFSSFFFSISINSLRDGG